MPPPEGRPDYVLTMNVVNTITHLLIGGVTTVVVMFGYDFAGSAHFRQHIILCTVGYVLLMSEAILSFNRHNGWSSSMHFHDKKTAHWIVQIVGSSLAIAGSIIRIQGYGGTHLGTPHGILGVIALGLTFLSLIGGVLNLYIKKNGKLVKICHALVGSLTLIFAIVSLCLGIDKASFRTWSSDSTASTMIAFSALLTVGALSSACPSILQRLRS